MFFDEDERRIQQSINCGRDRSVVCFSIVVYRELFYQTNAFVSLLRSFSYCRHLYDIYIYDNTDLDGWNGAFFDNFPNVTIHYHGDKSNAGISKAYNFLAASAKSKGVEWIVFLDQDTSIPENAVSRYTEAIGKAPEFLIKAPILLVANKVFSPFRVVFTRSVRIKKLLPGPISLQDVTVINSGMMVNLKLFFEVGGYNERVKLDFSDFLFLDRVKKRTNTIEVLNFYCQHEFSNKETDKKKVLKRYSLYVIDLINCPKPTFKSKVEYFILGLLHTVKLTMRFHSMDFIKLWSTKLSFKNYVSKQST